MLAACIVLGFAVPAVVSQEPVPEPAAIPAAASAPPVAEDRNDDSIREQTIYIPYSKLREVFEKEGRGVFLPYNKFQELWNAAQDKTANPPQPAVPVDALVVEAQNEATISNDVVRVQAKLTLELLKQGWNRVPLRLNGAAIQSARIDGKAARVVAEPNGEYSLLIENTTKGNLQVQLDLEYVRAYTKSPGQNSVSFFAPQAPVNRWRIRIPEGGIKVNVHPMIAASEEPAGQASNAAGNAANGEPASNAAAAETVLLAFVGAAPEVRIDWTPKSEGATGMDALVNVFSEQQLVVEEGMLRTRAVFRYMVSRAELDKLTLDLPADQKVVNVSDANVKRWEIAKEASQDPTLQRLIVDLFEPVRGTQSIAIELEKFIEVAANQELVMPVISAVGVGRQQGMFVVAVDPALRAEVGQRVGLSQIEVTNLPQTFEARPWAFGYSYSALPYQFSLKLEKVEPRISVEHLVEAYVEPEQVTLDMLAIYQIDQAGVFQLEVDVPAGYDIRQVRGVDANGAAAVAVDAYRLSEDGKRIAVNLTRKAQGRVALFVELQKALADANLLTPTGVASSIALELPRVFQAKMERSQGRVIVYTPESLRATVTKSDGLRALSFADAINGMQSMREGRFTTARETFAFAFAEQAVDLQFSVERRKPFITARQLLAVRTESGVTKFDAKFFYDIRYSGVKTLRIDVPTEISADVRNQSPAFRETALAEPPTDITPGCTAWTFTSDTELLGQTMLHLVWERKTDELQVGKSQTVSVPRLKPMGIDRAWGQIVATKAEAIDVQPDSDLIGLRGIDPQHDMMPGANVTDITRAFEFHDDWKLQLVATRYQLEEVKRTSIERAWLRMVTTRSGQVGVQAHYRLKSARQRLALQLPKEASFDSQPLRINGTPVTLERGENDTLFVPLIGHDPSEAIVMELRYSLEDDKAGLLYPTFPEDPAVQKVYLSVYIPSEQKLVAWNGPWTDEWTWSLSRTWDGMVTPSMDENQLMQWVKEGVNCIDSPTFQTDGRPFLFSTLRPEAAPNGLLHLSTIHEKILIAACIGSLIVLGLLILLMPLRQQLILVAFYGCGLMLIGAFAPTLARQIFNAPMIYGMGIVGLLWAVRFLGWAIPGWLKRQSQWMSTLSKSRRQAAVAVATSEVAQVPAAVDSASSDTKTQGGSQHE